MSNRICAVYLDAHARVTLPQPQERRQHEGQLCAETTPRLVRRQLAPEIEVVDFPAFIVIDDKGNDFCASLMERPGAMLQLE